MKCFSTNNGKPNYGTNLGQNLLFKLPHVRRHQLFQGNECCQNAKTTIQHNKKPVPQSVLQSSSSKCLTFSFLFLFGLGSSLDRSIPSTNSIANITHDSLQHMLWYSFPKGLGFLGTNIHPGQVYLSIQVDIDSSRHVIQDH